MNEYIENFASNADIISSYDAPADALDGATVLLAWYGYGDYNGESFVLFERDGKLWEVNGSHCSCYGLEDQWCPKETSWKALAMRNLANNYTAGANMAHQILQELVAKHLSQM